MVYSITQWKLEFLKCRGFDQPTGIPLYSYRMSSQEFEDLGDTLKDRLVRYLDLYSLVDISRLVPLFPALFVIYAAEWWRRRYDGSGWAWEPILDSIGLPSESWSPSQRSECVEKGLRDWGLKLLDSQGLRFLGSIAFQGGLPMQLLATSRGNIGRLLSKVLKISAKGNVEAKDIQDWIRSLSNELPKAYRQNEIYFLLAEVVLSVLRLKTDANLKSASGALAELDAFNSNWRNTFPLPIEDAQAQGLIDQLIRDAAEVKLSKLPRKVFLERWLESVDGFWELHSDVNLPEYLDAGDLKTLFRLDDSPKSIHLTLRLFRNNEVIEISLRKLPGQERYKVEKKPTEANNISVTSEHSMSLNTGEGETFFNSIVKGEALSADLPWLFEVDELQDYYPLLRQGGGAIGCREALVCIPHNWKITSEVAVNVLRLGSLKYHERTTWRVSSTATIYDTSNRIFRVRCGQLTANNEVLELRGSRLWEIFSQPNLAFTGVPKLYSITENGIDQQAGGPIGWRLPNGSILNSPSEIRGPIDAYWPANGEIKWHSRLVLLQETAKINVEPGETPLQGSVRFSNWGLLTAYTEDADIKTILRKVGNDLLLDFNYIGSGNPPEWCDLKVLWPNNTNIVGLKVPFPSKGVRAIDSNGNQLANKHQILINSITGIRLVGFLGGAKRAELTICLHNANSSNALSTIRKVIKSNKDQSRLEIRLIDYARDINKLLAGIDALDATVSFKLQIGGASSYSIRIAKYSCELTRLAMLPGVGIPQSIFDKLSTDELSNIFIYALRLDAPGDEPIKLEQKFSEGVATGNWIFPISILTSGPWMIYPPENTGLVFRPLIWSIIPLKKSNEETQSIEMSLSFALKIADINQRNEMLDDVTSKLSSDYLDPDWLQVEQLAINLGHLPLSTLDLWRSFTHSSRAMASLHMRLGTFPAGFVERFSLELPWMCEIISLDIWADSIALVLNQCQRNYGQETGMLIFNNHIDRRIQDITILNPSIRILLELAKAKVTGKVSQDIVFSQKSFMEKICAEQLFSGEDCLVQKLLRNNAEVEHWPNDFMEDINKARQSELKNFLCPKRYDFHDVVINIPIILALNSVLNLPLNGINSSDVMRTLRAIQDFDVYWFSDAFDLTVARCLASGIIHIKKES